MSVWVDALTGIVALRGYTTYFFRREHMGGDIRFEFKSVKEICVNSASGPGRDSLFCLLSRLIRWTVWKSERLYPLECDKFPIDRICGRGWVIRGTSLISFRFDWIFRSWCNLAEILNCRGHFHPVLPHLCSLIRRWNIRQKSIHVLPADIQTDALHFASYHNPHANSHVQLFMIVDSYWNHIWLDRLVWIKAK